MNHLQLRLMTSKDPETRRRVQHENYGTEGFIEVFPLHGTRLWATRLLSNNGSQIGDHATFPSKALARQGAFAQANGRQPVAQTTAHGVFQLWFHPKEAVLGIDRD